MKYLKTWHLILFMICCFVYISAANAEPDVSKRSSLKNRHTDQNTTITPPQPSVIQMMFRDRHLSNPFYGGVLVPSATTNVRLFEYRFKNEDGSTVNIHSNQEFSTQHTERSVGVSGYIPFHSIKGFFKRTGSFIISIPKKIAHTTVHAAKTTKNFIFGP